MFSLLESNKDLLNKHNNKPQRKPCECGVVTKSLCILCSEVNICGRHKVCLNCKKQKIEDKQILLETSVSEQLREEARKKARDAYRIKNGIPTELPLLPRGGARNCKHYSEEELEMKHEASKIYQINYQKDYNKRKKHEALKRKTLELMNEQASIINNINKEGGDATNEIKIYKDYELYFKLLESKEN